VVNLFEEEFDVYVGRAGFGKDGLFGNPYRLYKDGTRDEILEKFRKYFHHRLSNDPAFHQKVHDLKGLRLGCFCRDIHRCHATIIAAYVNTISNNDQT